jgi:hypothetical protein
MKPTRIPEPDPAFNMRWIKEHGAEYAGRWVALDGDRLVIYLPRPDEPDEIGF